MASTITLIVLMFRIYSFTISRHISTIFIFLLSILRPHERTERTSTEEKTAVQVFTSHSSFSCYFCISWLIQLKLWCYIAVPLDFSRTVRLYCSFVTKELLLSSPKYAFWEEYTVSPNCCCSQYL